MQRWEDGVRALLIPGSTFQEEEAHKCARVGREEEGTSSYRPELGRVVFALPSAALSEDVLLLLLCDNAAVLSAVKKWVGQGGKATLERVCCLLVLNLVSSTLSCIRQPRPRLRLVKEHP